MIDMEPTTGDLITVARGISDYGLLVVAGAAFVLASIAQQYLMNKRYQRQQELNEDRYNQLLAKILSSTNNSDLCSRVNALIESVDALLTPIGVLLNTTQDSIKEECTLFQAERVVKDEYELFQYRYVKAISKVVERNNVHENEDATKEKLKKIINTLHRRLASSLDSFKLSNVALSTVISDDISSILLDQAFDYVMAFEHNVQKFLSDCDVICEEYLNISLQKLKEL